MAGEPAGLEGARTALSNKEYKDALVLVKEVLRKDPGSYEALLLASEIASAAGETEQTHKALERAVETSPSRPEAWKALASLAKASHDTDAIIRTNSKLLELLPEDEAGQRFDCHAALAAAFTARSEFCAAAKHVGRQLDLGDLYPEERLDLQCARADLELRAREAAVATAVDLRLRAALEESAAQCGDAMAAPAPSPEALRRDVLVELAAVDAGQGEPGDESTPLLRALRAICTEAPLALRYTRYFDELLRRSLLRIFTAPVRSAERQAARRAALRECWELTCPAGAGGCSALPYESAIWLLEEEEEMKGGGAPPGHATVGAAVGMSQPAAAPALGANPGPAAPLGHAHATSAAVVTALENFARRFMHRFPDNPNARACLALMLRRRSVGDGSLAVPQATRRDLERLLADALRDPARLTCATAWKALAELQYENRGYEAAADTALRGLHWLQARREAGHEALTQVALALRLAMAKSLRRLGRLDEAERHFSVLAGWVTEGETAFAEMSGATPVSIHQQALRGMALVALARGDEHAAKAQYERILGKAAMGRGPGEHWAHADYGWLLYKDGDLQGARQHLEDAVRVALGPESYVTDSQLGEHYQRLGEVYWAMRGRYRREKQFAYHQFLEAAKAEGHSQAPALAGLGRYFLEVEHSPEQASRCFKRALALDPTLELPGEGLCRVLRGEGRRETVRTLCAGIAQRAPSATWAHRKLGALDVESGAFDAAVPHLQAAIRGDPRDAAAWEALGAAYEGQGRPSAARRAFDRALGIDPCRVPALTRAAGLAAALGDLAAGLAQYRAAVGLAPQYPPALLGLGRALLAAAGQSLGDALPGRVAAELAEAADLARRCVDARPGLRAGWKLLGDALLALGRVAAGEPGADAAGGGAALPEAVRLAVEAAPEALRPAFRGRSSALRALGGARRAYAELVRLEGAQVPPDRGEAESESARPPPSTDVATATLAEALAVEELARAVAPGDAVALRSHASSLLQEAREQVRGALALSPACSRLWALCAATCREDTEKAEYALARSLQLDPRNAPAWTQLARLYVGAGRPGAADACLQAARTHAAASPGVWEAMGDAEGWPAAALGLLEHAVGLGAGATHQLRFAALSLGAPAGPDASRAYLAALKASRLLPLDPAAHAALGMALQRRGDAAGAAEAYGTAAQLARRRGDLDLEAAVLVRRAAALVEAGDGSTALRIFAELDTAGRGGDLALPSVQRTLAHAHEQSGDLDAAHAALSSALEGARSGGEAFGVLEDLVSLAWLAGLSPSGRLEGVLLPRAQVGPWPVGEGEVRALRLRAAELEARAGDVEAVRGVAHRLGPLDAEAAAHLCLLQAAATQTAGSGLPAAPDDLAATLSAAARRCAAALHLCPRSAPAQVALAATSLRADPARARAALGMLCAVLDAGATPIRLRHPALEAATSALLALPPGSSRRAAREHLARLARAVHAAPDAAPLWVAGAAVAAHAAAGQEDVTGAQAGWRRAAAWAGAARGVSERQPALPLRFAALACQAEALAALGRADAALLSGREAVRVAAGSVHAGDALCVLGRVLWAGGRADQAAAAFMRAQAPGNPISAAAAGLHLAALSPLHPDGDRPGAEALLRDTLKQSDSAILRLTLAGLLRDQGRNDEALEIAAEMTACSAGRHDRTSVTHAARLLEGSVHLASALQAGVGPVARRAAAGAALGALQRRMAISPTALQLALGTAAESCLGQKKSGARAAEGASKAQRTAVLESGQPLSTDLLLFLSRALRRPSLCARAVHARPWEGQAWAALTPNVIPAA
ncbi:THK3 [Auxenochlorella protothecoides x Auxenochlorella symbiontica]